MLNKMINFKHRIQRLILGVLSIIGFAGMASAQCSVGEIEVYVDVTTDQWGYEMYWELLPTGNACGTGTVFAGGNAAQVGCAGSGATAGNGYASNTTITEGPFCLIEGDDYDIYTNDDYGDGGSIFVVKIAGVPLQINTFTAVGANSIFTFTALLPTNNTVFNQEYYDTLTPGVDSSSTRYYTNIPIRQAEADLIWFAGDLLNQGTVAQTNVVLNTTVMNGSNTVFDDNAPAIANFGSGASAVGIVPTSFTPTSLGTYDVTFTLSADLTDEVPSDNMATSTIEVTDTVYSRDDDNYTGWGSWAGAGTLYKMCNWFEVPVQDTVTSVSIYFQGNTTVGAVIQVHIFDNALTALVGASSAFITLTAGQIGQWITIDIPDTPLPPGGYAAGIEIFSTEVLVAIDPDLAPPQTSFIEIGGTWYFMGSIPYIRMNTKAPAVLCNMSASTSAGTDLNCNGNANGTATATGAGGTAPYTYLWDDTGNSTTGTISTLDGGVYNCLITDANGCSYTVAVNIDEPDVLSLTSGVTDVICFGDSDGVAMAIAAGGTAPYTYLWDDPGTQTTANATGLKAGSYNVVLSDANGCPTANITVVVSEPAAMGLNFSSTTANCGIGGTASVNVTGGLAPFTYSWNDPDNQTGSI
ncbi:MAG TPA: hypothetical protein EYN69_08630, partial [Flavobacteriales bacterium]|nr:hypothetical protein [Flavobacteriales bacterium]